MTNYQLDEENTWNPFIPTKRDIKRTEELAKKNCMVAGILSFLFLPIGLVYLNRGINTLKILGYIFVLGFLVGMSSGSEEEAVERGNVIGIAGTIAISVEQVRTITEARKRKTHHIKDDN